MSNENYVWSKGMSQIETPNTSDLNSPHQCSEEWLARSFESMKNDPTLRRKVPSPKLEVEEVQDLVSCKQADEWYVDVVPDVVTQPSHYKISNDVEVIDVIEHALTEEEFAGYVKGNAIKYLLRHNYKGKPTEDVQKAKEYLTKYYRWREIYE